VESTPLNLYLVFFFGVTGQIHAPAQRSLPAGITASTVDTVGGGDRVSFLQGKL